MISSPLTKINLKRCNNLSSFSIFSSTLREINLMECTSLNDFQISCEKLISIDLSNASTTENSLEFLGKFQYGFHGDF